MINLTDNAKDKIIDLLAEEQNPQLKIRLFIHGGGCSGFNYGFTFDEIQNEDDWEFDGLLIDAMSMQYLDGAIVDYKTENFNSQFVITNPNATHTCGCGQSFAV